MDIGRAFSFPFQDSAWVKKVLIGAVLILTIVGIPAVVGYTMRIMRLVVSGVDRPLPEWENIGELWIDGIKAIVIGIVWSIPSLIIQGINYDGSSLALTCIGTIVSLACSVLSGIALVNVATKGALAAGFEFGEIINKLTSNVGDYIIIFFMSFVIGLVAASGLIACGIGVLATAAYAFFVQSHLWAQAFRRSGGAGDLPPAPRF